MNRDYLVNNILPQVEKPMRYTGAELNSVRKDWKKTELKTLFAFPDIYEIGMSHLGLSIIYHRVNRHEDFLMERTFSPWVDLEEILKKENIPLWSLESFRAMGEFDVIGIPLQYEMSYSNILNMLDMGGVPLLAADRLNDESPLVIAGGSCSYNGEPLADFIDLFILGEGEDVIIELFEALRDHRRKNGGRTDKKVFLEEACRIRGIYVPSLYQPVYGEDGSMEDMKILYGEAPAKVEKRIVPSLDEAYFPVNPIVPYIEPVHDRAMVEVLRGCTRGCRFCQAGMLYRPVRERTPGKLKEQADEILRSTGHNEIALTSLSTSDYSCVEKLIADIFADHEKEQVGISLPSLRVDSFSVGLAEKVQKVRRSSLTFAPEAGTQRMRDVINKGVSEEDLMAVTKAAFSKGWLHIKLYFMIGLPTETYEDLDGIVDLARKVLNAGDAAKREHGLRGPAPTVTVSASGFVPKPHTPFQWFPQVDREELKNRQQYIKKNLRNKRIRFKYHDADLSFMEAVFSKGDRKLGRVLLKAHEKGCHFDSWDQFFDLEKWQEAFREAGLDPSWYAYRELAYDELLPWDHLSPVVRKEFLVRENERASAGILTGDCRYSSCSVCGVCQDIPGAHLFSAAEDIGRDSNENKD